MAEDCEICSGKADELFKRKEVWSNARWRLTMSTYKVVRGFCYLEPKRHIPYVTDLDGEEAKEFGSIIARVSSGIKRATDSKLVYVYVFGDHIPHLHVHLAPHTDGDVLTDDVIKPGIAIDKSAMNLDSETLPLSDQIRENIENLGRTDS